MPFLGTGLQPSWFSQCLFTWLGRICFICLQLQKKLVGPVDLFFFKMVIKSYWLVPCCTFVALLATSALAELCLSVMWCVVIGAAVAGVYRASGFEMRPMYALVWGVGQTILVIFISFTRILATLWNRMHLWRIVIVKITVSFLPVCSMTSALPLLSEQCVVCVVMWVDFT